MTMLAPLLQLHSKCRIQLCLGSAIKWYMTAENRTWITCLKRRGLSLSLVLCVSAARDSLVFYALLAAWATADGKRWRCKWLSVRAQGARGRGACHCNLSWVQHGFLFLSRRGCQLVFFIFYIQGNPPVGELKRSPLLAPRHPEIQLNAVMWCGLNVSNVLSLTFWVQDLHLLLMHSDAL